MDQQEFAQWSARVENLTDEQRRQHLAALRKSSRAKASVAAVEQAVGAERRCPHCGTTKARRHGHVRGLQRYRCRSCGRTFNAVSCSPLSRLRHKDRWLQFCRSMAKGESLRLTAQRCGIAITTAFRWRHRFLQAVEQQPDKLCGIVEADETFMRESQKGSRNLKRPPRRRGGPAEQVPILVAADRGGQTRSQVIPNRSTDALVEGLAPWVAGDALLVTDSWRSYPRCAAILGLRHETVNLSAGERVRGAIHTQTVNNRHSQWKDFLRPFRGVSTRYFDSYLRLFHLIRLAKQANGRGCLAAVINRPATRNAN